MSKESGGQAKTISHTPAKVRTNTTWEKYRQRRSMTQQNHEGQAVNLWSIQGLLILDPRV